MSEQLRQILTKGDEETKITEAVAMIDELEGALSEFGRSFYRC